MRPGPDSCALPSPVTLNPLSTQLHCTHYAENLLSKLFNTLFFFHLTESKGDPLILTAMGKALAKNQEIFKKYSTYQDDVISGYGYEVWRCGDVTF